MLGHSPVGLTQSQPPRRHLLRAAHVPVVPEREHRNADALEALYRRYARPVFALALRILRDRGRAEDAVQAAFEPGPAAAAEASRLAFRIHAAVAELLERERAVLELAYWGGQSQSEIARFLGIPLGTVKTRRRAGLARLAAILDGQL